MQMDVMLGYLISMNERHGGTISYNCTVVPLMNRSQPYINTRGSRPTYTPLYLQFPFLLSRTLIPIITIPRVPIRPHPIPITHPILLSPMQQITHKVQSPVTRHPPGAHTRTLRLARNLLPNLPLLIETLRLDQIPSLRCLKLTQCFRSGFLGVPLVRRFDIGPFRMGFVFGHGFEVADEVGIDFGGFIPPAQPEVGLFQEFDLQAGGTGVHGIEGAVVAVVAFGHEAEDVFVHALRFARVAHVGVELGEQVGHLEGFGVEGAPDAAEVVADVFAEADGFGAALLGGVEVAGLDEAAPDFDDGVGFPVLLDFATLPEKFEDPLG